MLRTSLATIVLAASVHAAAEERYPTNGCIERLGDEPRLEAIAHKVALASSEHTSAAMFHIENTPSGGVEQSALALWSKLRQACFELGAGFRRDMANQEHAALAGRLFHLHQALLGELRAGQLTYAEFNRRRVDLYLVARSLESAMTEQATPARTAEISEI